MPLSHKWKYRFLPIKLTMSERCEKRSSSPLSSIGTLRICLTLLSSRPSVVLSGANLYAHKKHLTTGFRTFWSASKPLHLMLPFYSCPSHSHLLSHAVLVWLLVTPPPNGELAQRVRTFKKPLHKIFYN